MLTSLRFFSVLNRLFNRKMFFERRGKYKGSIGQGNDDDIAYSEHLFSLINPYDSVLNDSTRQISVLNSQLMIDVSI